MTGYLQELRARAIKFGMSEIPAKMDSIVESVIYGHAIPAYAREELDLIWLEVEAEEEIWLEPPTEEELKLLHPNFDV